MRKMFLLAALLVAVCAVPSPSRGQEGGGDEAEVTKMAKEHYRAGLEAYKAGQYDVAIKELKRAYLLKRLPPLLLNIGATYRKMGDLDLALHFYKKYLDEAPPDARDRSDVEATVKEIENEKGGGGKEAATTPPPDTSAQEATKEETPAPRKRSSMPSEWSHTVVDAAPPNIPLDVRVAMPIMKGVKVYVFYRGPGESDYQQVLMKRHGTEKVGRIPADAMNGNAVQYYVEARDTQGQVVKNSGSQTSPNIVMIDPSAPPQMIASLETSRDREGTAPEPAEVEKTPGRGDRDEEEAPLLVEGKKNKRDRERRSRSGGGESGGHALRWAGVGLLAAGVAFAGISGGMFYEAKVQSDAVAHDSQGGKFLFKDPNANGADDSHFQAQGQLYNTLGIAFSALGGVAAVAGVALVVVDAVKGGGGHDEKPKRTRKTHEDESTWYLAPTAGQRQVGVGGGFSF